MTLQTSALFVAAFVFALLPLQAYEAEFFLAAFVILSTAFIEAVLREGQWPKANPLLLAGFGFWALAFLSVVFSEIPFVSFIYFCFFSVMPLSFLLPLLLQQKERFFKYTSYGLGAVFAALGVFTVAEYFLLPTWLNHGSVHWPLTDPNSFAEMYALAFFCSVGLMLGGQSRVQSNAGLILSLLFMCCILMSGSKGVLFCLLAGMAIFAFAAWPHVKKHWRCCAWLAAGSAIMFVALIYLGSSPQKAFWLKYSTEYGLYPRNALLSGAWQIAQDHFWMGTGIGTFFLYYPEYRHGDTLSAGFMAHNDPLQFFSEMGIFAPLLFYGFIVLAGMRTLKVLKTAPPGSRERIFIMAPFCGLGTLAVHCHINFDLNILPLLMLGGLLLGFWYLKTETAPAFVALSQNARGAAAFAVLAFMSVFAVIQCSEILTSQAQQKIAQGDLDGFMADVNMANTLAMGRNARALVLAASVPIVVLETGKASSQEEADKYKARAEDLLRRAEQNNPRLPAVPYYKARLYSVAVQEHAKETPEELLQQALTLNPLHLASRQMLAEIWAKQGRKKEALDLMKTGLRWRGATPEYYLALAQLARQNGDMDLHDTALAKMLVGHAQKLRNSFQQGVLRSYGVLE